MNKFDIIGDVHGCYNELKQLLTKLGYTWNNDAQCYHWPNTREKRTLVYVGDLIDRGPDNWKVVKMVRNQVMRGIAHLCMGNHDDKYMRYLMGRNVTISDYLQDTIDQISRNLDEKEILSFYKTVPYFHALDECKLVVVHAAWHEGLKNNRDKRNRTWCIYGPNNGIRDDGKPERIDWVHHRKIVMEKPLLSKREPPEDCALIVYGHQPYREPRVEKNTIGIDTGCVFGGELTALRYPEMEFESVPGTKYAESLGWGFKEMEIDIGDYVEVNDSAGVLLACGVIIDTSLLKSDHSYVTNCLTYTILPSSGITRKPFTVTKKFIKVLSKAYREEE